MPRLVQGKKKTEGRLEQVIFLRVEGLSLKARRTPLTHQVYSGGAATLEGKRKLLYTERGEVPDSTYGGFSDK